MNFSYRIKISLKNRNVLPFSESVILATIINNYLLSSLEFVLKLIAFLIDSIDD